MKDKFAISLIFLTVVLGIAGFWYYQNRIFSKDILKMEIIAPTEAKLLEEIEYLVKYQNNGDVRLEEAKLIFEYPRYSVVKDGESLRKQIDLEDIYPGQEKTHTFKARLLGKIDEIKEAKAFISYRPKNLNAFYESETIHTLKISEAPLTFDFDLPSKMESGREIKFRLNYFSNINYPLSNLGIKVAYPSGFQFIESNPSSLENTEWEVGLLNIAEGGRIEITGKLEGEVGESKVFRAELGQWHEGEFVILKTANWGVEIIKPLLYIFREINGNPLYIANSGDLLDYKIFFKNIGERILENLFLMIELENELLDWESFRTESSRFERIDNKIIWDHTMLSDLRKLLPMQEGGVEFWIKLKENPPTDVKNPEIKSKITLDGFKEEFITKINSKLEIIQKGFFEDEVFGNSGPIPPRVGETTTYTVIWQVKNAFNEVKNVKVKASLPSEVKLTGKIFPKEQSSKFAFDSDSREIVWDVGDLTSAEGIEGPGPNIAFQIAFKPNSSQRGKVATLIEEAKVFGEDQWTEATLERSDDLIDTTLPDDNTVAEKQGIIQ